MNITLKEALDMFSEDVEIVLKRGLNFGKFEAKGTPLSLKLFLANFHMEAEVLDIDLELEFHQVFITI